eukprot:Gb_36591 [translate_table: standard]
MGDSNLVINQMQKRWTNKSWHLEDKVAISQALISNFNLHSLRHIPRSCNHWEDDLANLGALILKGLTLHVTASKGIIADPQGARASIQKRLQRLVEQGELIKRSGRKKVMNLEGMVRSLDCLAGKEEVSPIPRHSSTWESHLLAKEMVRSLEERMACLEDSTEGMQRELKLLKKEVKIATTTSIHVLHELSHFRLKMANCSGHHFARDVVCGSTKTIDELRKGMASPGADPG